MSNFELKEGQGTMFENDKGGNASRPDRRGEIMIGGTVYELAGWIKVGQSGKRFMSLSAKPKQARQQERQAPKRNAYAERDDGYDNSPPF